MEFGHGVEVRIVIMLGSGVMGKGGGLANSTTATGSWKALRRRALGLDSVAFREPMRSNQKGNNITTLIF